MEQIETSKAAKGFGSLIERVIRGETVVLTRYGRGVAQITPLTKDPRLEAPDLDVQPVTGPARSVIKAPAARPMTAQEKARAEQSARDALLRRK